jgi:LasA protease
MKKRTRLLAGLLACFVLALACNFPIQSGRSTANSAARETLIARLLPSATALPEVNGHPSSTPASQGLSAELQTAEPDAPLPTNVTAGPVFSYSAQPGDTLAGLAGRFGVSPSEISSQKTIPAAGLIPDGQPLSIPNHLGATGPGAAVLPDSEIVYSPSAAGFDTSAFIRSAGGFLNGYTETVDKQSLSGAQIVQRVADETSTNPRLLLALLDYRSHWVTGQPIDPNSLDFPIGFADPAFKGLYNELNVTSRQLTIGYYGWRSGTFTSLLFSDKSSLRINPGLNAGSVAMQNFFATFYHQDEWASVLYGSQGFPAFYKKMFGDPWQRAAAVEPILPDNLKQPALELPFQPGLTWTFTGGPHAAWGVGSAWGGLDFAPANVAPGCGVSPEWVTASAPGRVIHSGNGMVTVNLGGIANEQVGWVQLYLHIADQDRVAARTVLKTNDPIGHPSCVGGFATGTHVHVARKYNGEWLAAGQPIPFVLSGWTPSAGSKLYHGSLSNGSQTITSRLDNIHTSLINR